MTGLSVLHLSTADILGGSARSAYRIHGALRDRGHRSRMLVGIRASEDEHVDTVFGGELARRADRAADKLTAALGLQYAYLPSSRRVRRHPWVGEADIIQLYNTHGAYLSQGLIPALSRRAAVVWRLSDMWPMTGHCAYPGPCQRWRTGCGRCPDLAAYPPLAWDTTAFLFRYKDRLYRRSAITVVATSSWMEACARESPLMGRFRVVRIANGVDGALFRPGAGAEARARLGIDAGRKVILFAAHGLDGNARKGTDLLMEALNRLAPGPEALLLLLGAGGESWPGRVPVDVRLLGFSEDPGRVAEAFAAADVVAIPSRVENLPNVLIEALASGRPAVACDVGGMADGVRHMETGYLARPGDAADVARGLGAVLGDEALRRTLGANARELYEREFTAEAECRRYEALYGELLEGRRGRERISDAA